MMYIPSKHVCTALMMYIPGKQLCTVLMMYIPVNSSNATAFTALHKPTLGTHLLVVQFFPRACHNSISLDVRQFNSSCFASWVSTGAAACSPRFMLPWMGSRLAS